MIDFIFKFSTKLLQSEHFFTHENIITQIKNYEKQFK